jgi:Uncharacterized protein conserved in bacteria
MNEMLQILLGDLRAILRTSSQTKRETILCRVTDLFFAHANVFSADRIAAFDEVIGLLIENVSATALVDLSRKLAALDNAPMQVVSTLARHSNIDIARPLLEISTSLGDDTLVEVVKLATQKHLAVIATRAQVSATVTDALIDRADDDVIRMLVPNTGAHLSELSFAKLINRAKTNSALVQNLAERADFPAELEPFLRLAMAS